MQNIVELPKLSESILGCCGLPVDPTGRILPRFPPAEKSITGDGAEEEIGLGERAIVTEPSGPYFLGLPLFFFKVVAPGTPAATDGSGVTPISEGVTVTGGADPLTRVGFSVVLGATW